jgi:DNA uptake protein ComE-like DNA-binding protein
LISLRTAHSRRLFAVCSSFAKAAGSRYNFVDAPCNNSLQQEKPMFPRKKFSGFAPLSFALLLMFVFSACSSGGDNRSSGATNANTASSQSPAATPAATTPAPNASSAPKAKLNINTASEAEFLTNIPNFGNRMAHEFDEYRPYKSIQQFRKEIGKYVDQNQVAEYEKYIFVPIDENQSDALTLQQIPGLDANEAQELIAGRPYASRDAFLAKLGAKVSPEELAVAKTYLVQQ